MLALILAIGAALLFLGGIFQGIVAGIEIAKHAGGPKQMKRWSLIILVCVILAVFSGYGAYVSYNSSNSPKMSPPPTATSSPTSTLSSTPNTTVTPVNTSSGATAGSSIVKNLTLTCSQCASEPVHVTINSVQIDNTNGKMIWDTTLRDVTGSKRGFEFQQYTLEASGSTVSVNGQLSQSQFVGINQADIQAIFAFVPTPNTTYTLTIVVVWAFSTDSTLSFDPVKITF